MGLQIKISAEEKENSILIYDCTGVYSGDNRGGFGGVNPQISDIIGTILFVQTPSSTEYYPYQIDISGAIPNREGIPYELFPSEIGQTEVDSGLYKFKLVHTVQSKGGTLTEKVGLDSEVFVKNISCCIDKHSPELDKDLFKDPKQKAIAEMQLLLRGVIDQIDNGLNDKANTTIDYLKLQCKCSNC